jgi:hypothetical protein
MDDVQSCLLSSGMMEAVRTSETSDNHFTRQYNPEDSSEHHTRRRENLKSHSLMDACSSACLSNFLGTLSHAFSMSINTIPICLDFSWHFSRIYLSVKM